MSIFEIPAADVHPEIDPALDEEDFVEPPALAERLDIEERQGAAAD